MNQPQQAIDLEKMRKSPNVSGEVNYENVEDDDIDVNDIFWLGTNINLVDTPQEQLETRLAIQHQIKNGVIDEFGLPIGFTYQELGLSKEQIDQINQKKKERQQKSMPISETVHVKPEYKTSWDRKRDRAKNREEQKKQEKLAKANQQIRNLELQNYLNNNKKSGNPIINILKDK